MQRNQGVGIVEPSLLLHPQCLVEGDDVQTNILVLTRLAMQQPDIAQVGAGAKQVKIFVRAAGTGEILRHRQQFLHLAPGLLERLASRHLLRRLAFLHQSGNQLQQPRTARAKCGTDTELLHHADRIEQGVIEQHAYRLAAAMQLPPQRR